MMYLLILIACWLVTIAAIIIDFLKPHINKSKANSATKLLEPNTSNISKKTSEVSSIQTLVSPNSNPLETFKNVSLCLQKNAGTEKSSATIAVTSQVAKGKVYIFSREKPKPVRRSGIIVPKLIDMYENASNGLSSLNEAIKQKKIIRLSKVKETKSFTPTLPNIVEMGNIRPEEEAIPNSTPIARYELTVAANLLHSQLYIAALDDCKYKSSPKCIQKPNTVQESLNNEVISTENNLSKKVTSSSGPSSSCNKVNLLDINVSSSKNSAIKTIKQTKCSENKSQQSKDRCSSWPNCLDLSCKSAHPSKTCRLGYHCKFKRVCAFIHEYDRIQSYNFSRLI